MKKSAIVLFFILYYGCDTYAVRVYKKSDILKLRYVNPYYIFYYYESWCLQSKCIGDVMIHYNSDNINTHQWYVPKKI